MEKQKNQRRKALLRKLNTVLVVLIPILLIAPYALERMLDDDSLYYIYISAQLLVGVVWALLNAAKCYLLDETLFQRSLSFVILFLSIAFFLAFLSQVEIQYSSFNGTYTELFKWASQKFKY